MVTNNARWTREVKSGFAIAKAAFSKRKELFQQQIALKLKE